MLRQGFARRCGRRTHLLVRMHVLRRMCGPAAAGRTLTELRRRAGAPTAAARRKAGEIPSLDSARAEAAPRLRPARLRLCARCTGVSCAFGAENAPRHRIELGDDGRIARTGRGNNGDLEGAIRANGTRGMLARKIARYPRDQGVCLINIFAENLDDGGDIDFAVLGMPAV